MKGLLTTYRNDLPITPNTPALTLGEGDTPLVTAPAISRETGAGVWLKLEGCNPTGSFKDRGVVVAVAKVVEEKVRAVKCVAAVSVEQAQNRSPISNLQFLHTPPSPVPPFSPA